MNNIMLDLETLGTRPNAPIIAIGAVEFDSKTGKLGNSFYEVIDFKSAVEAGGVIDPDTVMWWMKQSDEARGAFSRTGMQLESALTAFRLWLLDCSHNLDIVKIWGNGASFDNVLLAESYKRCGYEVPWKFWNDMCYRTVKNLNLHIKMSRTGTAHNALDDAKSQVLHLMSILQGTV